MPRLSNLRLLRLAALLWLPVIPAMLAAFLHPVELPWNPEELKAGEVLLEDVATWKHVVWIDVRSEQEYLASHVADALWLSQSRWEEKLPMVLQHWQPEVKVLVYCASDACQSSREVAARLRNEVGLEEVYTLKGGWQMLVRQAKPWGLPLTGDESP